MDSTCQACKSTAKSTTWRPGLGIDPRMKGFKCTFCKREFYLVVTELESQPIEDPRRYKQYELECCTE